MDELEEFWRKQLVRTNITRKKDKNMCTFLWAENAPESEPENDPEIGTEIKTILCLKLLSRVISNTSEQSTGLKYFLEILELIYPQKKPSTLMYSRVEIHFWGFRN